MDQQDALPAYWRSPRQGNAGVLYYSRLEAVQNFEQVTEPVYSAEQFRQAIQAERARCAAICRSRYMGDNTREDVEARACAEAILKG